MTTPRPLHQTLTYRLHLLHKLSDQESQKRYAERVGLSLSEGRCLASIGTFAPLSVNDLAKAANVNKAQASRAAQSLVEQGFVIKQLDPNDKRGVVLSLTPTGENYWHKTIQLISERNDEIFSSLSPDELTVFSQLLDRLIADLPPI